MNEVVEEALEERASDGLRGLVVCIYVLAFLEYNSV